MVRVLLVVGFDKIAYHRSSKKKQINSLWVLFSFHCKLQEVPPPSLPVYIIDHQNILKLYAGIFFAKCRT